MSNALVALSILGGSGFSTASTSASSGFNSNTPLNRQQAQRVAPWDGRVQQPEQSAVLREALTARTVIDRSLGGGPGSAVRDGDDRTLFTLHEAANKLKALATAASSDTISASDRKRFTDRFNAGLAEFRSFAEAADLERSILVTGKKMATVTSATLGRPSLNYVGKPISRGGADDVVAEFQGDVRFNIEVKKSGTTTNVAINLADMGATPRTIKNVSNFINTKLGAEGFATRLSQATITEPNRPTDAKSYGFQISRNAAETISFQAAANDTRPALYVTGNETITRTTAAKGSVAASSATTATGLVTKLTGLTGTDPTAEFRDDITAKDASSTARAVARGPDGSLYVVGDTTGKIDGATPKSSSDVFISKFDTTGKLVWTRLLGSAAPAQGFSVAVGANGTVAVAGTVEGRVDPTATGGGKDSFVAAFDDEGRDLWFRQKASTGDDSAAAIAVAADGTVLVAGSTRGSLGGQVSAGGSDAYVQAFSASGTLAWTKTLGTTADEAATALVEKDGAIFVAATGANGGSISKLALSTGAVDSGFSVTGASLGQSRIAALAIEGTTLIAGGAASSNSENGAVSSLNATNGTVNFSTQLTGSGSINAVAVGAGQIITASDARIGSTSAREGAINGLNATTGVNLWNERITGAPGTTKDGVTTAAGSVRLTGLAIAPNESKSLATLGLPEGALKLGDVTNITDRTALRAGDFFELAIDGGPPKKITIAQGETFRSLVTKMNRVLGGAATAETTRNTIGDKLLINPQENRNVEIIAGKGVADALGQLGLSPGIVSKVDKRTAALDASADHPRIIALELSGTLSLADSAKARSAESSINALMARIRNGYRDTSRSLEAIEFRQDQKLNSNSAGAGSAGNAYQQRQLANLQAGLARLGGTIA